MRRRIVRIGLTCCLLSTAELGLAQTPDPGAVLEGVWQISAPTNALTPIKGDVPLTAKGRKELKHNKELQHLGKYDDYDITKSRCSSPGVPRLMLTPDRFKIWQSAGFVTFDFEWNRALRQIDVRGAQLEPTDVPTMTGVSTGHWEGKTLVAKTTVLSDRTLLDDLLPHSTDMIVTERLRLTDPDTLEDRVTIEDPAYYSRPWDAVITYKRRPDAIFKEDVCMDRLPGRKSEASS